MTETLGRRFDRFMERLNDGDPNAAAEEFGRLCHGLRRGELKISPRVLGAFIEAWIDLFWQSRRHDLMLHAAEEARRFFGDSPDWAFARGEALFNLGRFDEARQELEPLTTDDFDEPMLYFLLACLAERRGEEEAATRLFQAANRLDAKVFQIPLKLGEDEAMKIFESCLKEIPEQILCHLRQVPVFVSPLPSDELIQTYNPPLDPLTMGLFTGQSVGEEDSPLPSDQPGIYLFHMNIAKMAGDIETLEDEMRTTLFHEIGHFLGFDEEQLEDMGLA